MALAVLAYPELEIADASWIEGLWKTFPQLRHAPVKPHFTLVFPVEDISERVFQVHVESVAADFASFPFALRCALPVNDTLSEHIHIFLVPDEGFSQVVRLHDALYTEPLAAHLRLEVPFIPHITVGYHEDAAYCKRTADAINTALNAITGTITTLQIVRLAGRGVVPVEQVRLGG